MNEQIVIEFVSDTKGLKDAADQLKALGKMSDEQHQAFMRMNETASTSMQERLVSTKQVAAEEKKAVQSVDELNQSFKGVVTTIAKGVLDTVIDEAQQWQKEADEAAQSNVRLSAELRKMQNELVKMAVAGKEGTKEFKELQKAAGKLKDDIGDVQARIKHFSSDTRHIDAVVQGFQAMTGAIAAVQGAQALFGDESEDVQKALLKVNAALALATGTQQVFQALQKEGAVVQGFLEAKTYAYGVALRAVSAIQTAFGISARAAWAMATLGVSLLITGIVSLILYWDELFGKVEEVKGLTKEQADDALHAYTLQQQAIEKNLRAEERRIELLKARGATQEEIDRAEIELLKKRIEMNDSLLNQWKKNSGEIVFTEEEQFGELLKMNQAFGEKIAEQRHALAIKEAEINKRRLDDAKAYKREWERIFRDIDQDLVSEEQVKAYATKITDVLDEEFATQEPPILIIRPEVDTEALKSVQSEFQATLDLANALVNAMSDLTQANLENELAAIDAKREAELKNKALTEEQKAKIQEKYDKQERALRKKAFEQDKKMKITLAMINGAAGVVNAFANAPNPFVAAAQAAAIAATTAAQIAIISQQQFPAYATGTEFVEGAGTPTSDSIMARLSVGERVVPANLNKMLGGVPNELLPKLVHDGLLIHQHRHGTDFDYEKLGDAVAKELSKQPKLVMNLDETGFSKHLIKGNSRQRILNSRYGIA